MHKNRFSQTCLVVLVSAVSLVGCYRMPTEEDYSVVPSTNNPDVTREKQGNNFMPTMGF
jgi:hypothetical protein